MLARMRCCHVPALHQPTDASVPGYRSGYGAGAAAAVGAFTDDCQAEMAQGKEGSAELPSFPCVRL